MLGTAFRQAGVLLVEQPGPWGPAGLASSGFDGDTARVLERRCAEAGLRLLAIRSPGGGAAGAPRRWVLGRAGAIRVGTFADDTALAQLPLHGDPGAADREPLYLVCTHGRRDPCCAVRGRPLVEALLRLRPGRVFECSHLGGHRFGANVLVLPAGVLYGRVPPSAAGTLVAATEGGRIVEELLRGHIGCGPAEQAALGFAHRHLGVAAARAIRVVGSTEHRDRWVVQLAAPGGPLSVAVALEEVPVPASSCDTVAVKTELRARVLGLQ